MKRNELIFLTIDPLKY